MPKNSVSHSGQVSSARAIHCPLPFSAFSFLAMAKALLRHCAQVTVCSTPVASRYRACSAVSSSKMISYSRLSVGSVFRAVLRRSTESIVTVTSLNCVVGWSAYSSHSLRFRPQGGSGTSPPGRSHSRGRSCRPWRSRSFYCP